MFLKDKIQKEISRNTNISQLSTASISKSDAPY